MASKQIIIHAEQLFSGKGDFKDRYIVVENGLIAEISTRKQKSNYSGIVTPAFIDAHSHIGMFREGEPGSEQEGNEILSQILPLSDPLNGIYFDDRAFSDAIDFGVLYSCVIPGSGNVFGGKAKVIRHNASHRGEALVKDYGYKMALGYNPRSTQEWKGERPNTRMGVYGILEKRFDAVLTKYRKGELNKEKKTKDLERKHAKGDLSAKDLKEDLKLLQRESELEFSTEEQALLDVLIRRKVVKVHVHKEDDVLYLIDLAKRYGLKVTAEHTGDVFHKEIFNLLADAGISIAYGPLGSFAYKVELLHSYYQNTKLLMESRATYGLMTDHPVIHVTALRDSVKFFLMFGMSVADGIALITRKNAELLEIEEELGSIEVGKKASILLWDRDPFHLSAMPRMVMEEGKVLRQSK